MSAFENDIDIQATEPSSFEHVGRFGGGMQRPLDWDAPHDDIPVAPVAAGVADQSLPAAQSYVQTQSRASAMRGEDYRISGMDVQQRWQRCIREEEALRQLAAEVERKERQANMAIRQMTPNFPPRFLCISPIVFHDIVADVPASRQGFVKLAFGLWWATVATIVINFALCLVVLLLPSLDSESAKGSDSSLLSRHVGLAAAYITGVPVSFLVWYWQLYKAVCLHSSVTYVAAFIGLFIGFAWAVFMAIGIVGLGGCGAALASFAISEKGTGAAVPVIVSCVLWGLEAIIFIVLAVRLKKYYNEDGASLEEAQRDVTSEAAKAYVQHQL